MTLSDARRRLCLLAVFGGSLVAMGAGVAGMPSGDARPGPRPEMFAQAVVDPPGDGASTSLLMGWAGLVTALSGLVAVTGKAVDAARSRRDDAAMQALDAKLEALAAENRSQSEQIRSLQSPLVLVVEDDETSGLGLQVLLTRAGFRADLAGSSRVAIAKLDLRPDWIVADLNLGGGETGWDTIQRASQLGMPCRSVACTGGVVSDEDLRKAAALGVERILPKPVPIAELATLLRSPRPQAATTESDRHA